MGELTKEVCFPSSKWLVSLFAIPLKWSVPAPLDLRPEHLIIDVSAAIPQNLIEFVPVALASRVRQIDAPVDDFFAVAARGARYEPAGTADDDALAFETLVAFRANSVGAGNENGVRMGRSLVEGVGHCGPARFLAGDRHPVGGDADDVRALERLQPKSLGKPTIVTDSDAEAADRRPKDWKAEITWFEEQILGGPKMHFA